MKQNDRGSASVPPLTPCDRPAVWQIELTLAQHTGTTTRSDGDATAYGSSVRVDQAGRMLWAKWKRLCGS
jgi:hypothetical protein